MRNPRNEHRRARTVTATLLAAALLLSACGDDAGDGDAAGEATGGTDAQPVGSDDAGDDAPTGGPAPDMTAEDGWNGPPAVDADHHAPGSGEVRIADEVIELTVECVDAPEATSDLFFFRANGEGTDAEGRRIEAHAARSIRADRESFYDYDGQDYGELRVSRHTEGMAYFSAMASPSDYDTTASNLPITHVDRDGTFSSAAELSLRQGAIPPAPEGWTEFTGRCQDGWNGPIYVDQGPVEHGTMDFGGEVYTVDVTSCEAEQGDATIWSANNNEHFVQMTLRDRPNEAVHDPWLLIVLAPTPIDGQTGNTPWKANEDAVDAEITDEGVSGTAEVSIRDFDGGPGAYFVETLTFDFTC